MTKNQSLGQDALDVLFNDARTYNGWLDRPVTDDILQKIFDLTKMAPTSANCSPMRVVFVTSAAQKERLKPMLDKGNVEKTMTAPVTAIIANDREFYNHLPRLFPHANAKSWFEGMPEKIEKAMSLNGTLQAGYFIMAARALGLDCGPMSGFDALKVKDEFFPDLNGEVNLLCNLGYGDASSIFPRSPRFDFDDVCKIV